ncbi:MAG: tetratricopeptide repeat protein [Bacteroidota bacterium]
MIRLLLAGLVALLGTGPILAQYSSIFTEADRIFKLAEGHRAQNLLPLAQSQYQEVLEILRPLHQPDAELLRIQSELNIAKIAVQLGKPDGEKLILDFVRRYQPAPIANAALLEIANYYFNANDLEKATDYYERIPTNALSREERAEVNFRLGYTNFVQQNFREAKGYFQSSKDVDSDYYFPTNYYLGMIEFFDGNYESAIRQFRLVERSPAYRDHIPYYLSQIYFAQGRYDELIAYAEPLLTNGSRLRNKKEISGLLGQAYFERADYQRAKPLLEEYARNNRRLREEELYQLAFTQYQTQDYANAVRTFQEVSSENSIIGQSANFYLADTYLRQGDRRSARSAFGAASRMDFDLTIKEEALFNYAKLSYELRDPSEAINAIQQLSPESRYYVEGQRLLGDLFASNRDYQGALDILERMPNRTPELQEAYQEAALLRGLQLMQNNDVAGAKSLLTRSLSTPVNSNYRAQALYWLADIAHQEADYPSSIGYISQFLTLAPTVQNLPPQSSVYTANYLQGYNYLKQDNYPAALDYFRQTVEGIQRNAPYITDADVRERVLGDAVLRSGDAYFKSNQYDQAIRYYDEAVNNRYSGFIYALYQKAIIEGLRGRTADKILALEQIAQQYPNSPYADDALFQLGLTYQSIGQLQQALTPFRTIVADFRTSSPLVNESLLQLGLVSYNLGNQEAAINYYKQIFSNNPTSSEADRALAALEEIYVRDMGRADLYFAFLETVPGYQVSSSGRDSINFRAAESQYEVGNYQRAVTGFTDYIRQFPQGRNVLTAYYHRGDSYAAQGMYNQALPDYEYVVGRGPSQYYLRALEKASVIAYNSEQDFAKAYQLYVQLETAAQTEDQRFEAQLGALRSAYRSGNTPGVETYSSKIANNPNASQQQATTANFYLGKIAYDRNQTDQALRYFEQVIANSDDEQTAEARYLRCKIAYDRGQLDMAQNLCIEANRESSGYPFWVAKTVILLSDVLRAKNDLYNSRAALQALLDNYNEDPEIVAEAQRKLAEVEQMINASSRLDNSAPTNPGRLEMDNSGGGRN